MTVRSEIRHDKLERLRADHGPAVPEFEAENRAVVRGLRAVAAGLRPHTLTAATSDENVASRRVLIDAGFAPDGPADLPELGGKRGSRFRRELRGC